jgi:hypothetical protein
VFDNVVVFVEHPVEGRIYERRNLEDAGRSPFPVDFFCVEEFLGKGKRGDADLLDAVCAVCIEIGKAKKPSVIDLNLV